MGIYRRPDSPFWWYWLEGTTIRKSTGVPKAAGSLQQEKELRRQATNVYVVAKARHAQQQGGVIRAGLVISYRDFARWFEMHETEHHRSAASEASMLRRLGLYFNRYTNLADIDADAVKEWMTWRARQVSRATVNRELDVLKRLMAAAVPKYLERSPIAGLRRFRTEEEEPRILTPDEEQRIIAAASLEDAAWLMTALDTLMRLSNVVNLKWAQVKFASRSIVPLNAKVKHDIVPMTTRMVTALNALRRDTEWVFPHFHRGAGTTAAKNRAIRRFDYLCQLGGVPHGRAANGVTFHCLRHTGATRALQRGASVRTVMKLGGWRDERSVMRYVHAADIDVRQAAESIARHAHDAAKTS